MRLCIENCKTKWVITCDADDKIVDKNEYVKHKDEAEQMEKFKLKVSSR